MVVLAGSSISSSGNGPKEFSGLDKLLAQNQCVRYHNRQRAYVSCTVTPETWRSDYRIIDEVTRPGGKIATGASFVIESGEAGLKPVTA